MMKRIAIIFIPIIFALHFPVAPQNLLPRGWASEIEEGKRWAQLFLSFYRSQTAEGSPRKESPKAEPDSNVPQPLVFRVAVMAETLQPAVIAGQRIQIQHAVEKCELSIRKMERQISLEKSARALERLKTIRIPERIPIDGVKVIRLRTLTRPA